MKAIITKLKLFLLILWMIVIFLFSSQPANQSSQVSLRAGRTICTVFIPGYKNLSGSEQTALAKKIEYPLRKAAHATEYAILGILFYLTLKGFSRKKRYPACILFCMLYASTDEFHQLFVPGRAGRITDVLIDTCGAVAGLLILAVIQHQVRMNKSCNTH